jgi:hypothetical protein
VGPRSLPVPLFEAVQFCVRQTFDRSVQPDNVLVQVVHKLFFGRLVTPYHFSVATKKFDIPLVCRGEQGEDVFPKARQYAIGLERWLVRQLQAILVVHIHPLLECDLGVHGTQKEVDRGLNRGFGIARQNIELPVTTFGPGVNCDMARLQQEQRGDALWIELVPAFVKHDRPHHVRAAPQDCQAQVQVVQLIGRGLELDIGMLPLARLHVLFYFQGGLKVG